MAFRSNAQFCVASCAAAPIRRRSVEESRDLPTQNRSVSFRGWSCQPAVLDYFLRDLSFCSMGMAAISMDFSSAASEARPRR